MGIEVQIRNIVAIPLGLIVASGAAAAILALLASDWKFFPPAFAIVLIVAVGAGLPIYLTARAARKDTPRIAAALGFAVGAVIPAILVFWSIPDQASVGGTVTVLDGRYTLAGWLQNLALLGGFGMLGVGGALLFWLLVGRGRRSSVRVGEARMPALRRTVLLAAAAVGFIAAAIVISYVSKDRSCHNPLRDGRSSIGQSAGFDLMVGLDQWSLIEAELQEFGHAGGWSIRSDVRMDPGFPWLQISLCRAVGTQVLVQGLADRREVFVGVYYPQLGQGWQPDFRALHHKLEARWPGQIAYRDGQGRQIARPAWAAAGNRPDLTDFTDRLRPTRSRPKAPARSGSGAAR